MLFRSKDHLNEKNNPLTLHAAKLVLQDLSQDGAREVRKNKLRFAKTLREQNIVKSLPVKTHETQAISLDLGSYETLNIPKFEVKKSNRQNTEGMQHE